MYAATMEVAFLFRSSDGGYSWSRTGMWSETTRVYAIAIDAADAQMMYAAVNEKGGKLSKSTDGGRTWFNSSQGLPMTGTTLGISNCTREVFLTSYWGIYESSDIGETWCVVSGLPNGNVEAATLSTDGSYLYMALYNSGIYRTRLISGKPN